MVTALMIMVCNNRTIRLNRNIDLLVAIYYYIYSHAIPINIFSIRLPLLYSNVPMN